MWTRRQSEGRCRSSRELSLVCLLSNDLYYHYDFILWPVGLWLFVLSQRRTSLKNRCWEIGRESFLSSQWRTILQGCFISSFIPKMASCCNSLKALWESLYMSTVWDSVLMAVRDRQCGKKGHVDKPADLPVEPWKVCATEQLIVTFQSTDPVALLEYYVHSTREMLWCGRLQGIAPLKWHDAG